MDCPSCGQPNPPDARYCGNCATELVAKRECASCGAENPAGQRFCNACGTEQGAPAASPAQPPEHLAERIRSARESLEGERKQVTVLFADVMGSMDLAEERDPEDWRAIMDRFFDVLCAGVHRFEGTVDKFTGDGIMALFGAPVAHEDHAQRACYAALNLQSELAAYAGELRREQGLSFSVRMGINSGEVVVGTIGADLSMEYTAVGHTVGLAQRMEQLAEPGKAYVTESTARLVDGYLALSDLGEFLVKGSRRPLRVYELAGVGAARGRLDVSRARGFSRFVGRDEEMRTLEAALEDALGGRPHVIGIVGEAGVGKSRLCDTFAERCRARGLPVYHATGHAHTVSVPLVPVLEIMRSYFDVSDLDSPQTARERIAGKLLLLDERFAEDLPLLFDFLGVPDPERPPPRIDPEARERQLLALTKRLIHAQSARQPGVTIFEDLHWIDPASDAFVANHVDAVVGTRGLTILNFRPEYRAEWMSKSYYQQIALDPLDVTAVKAMLRGMLGSDPSLDGLAELLHEHSAGNPFFVEEVARSLAETGFLDGEPGRYVLARPIEAIEVPASVQTVLAARIDRLTEEQKAVLQAAAVLGRECPDGVLERVAGLEREHLDDALRALLAAEFLFERELYPEPVYAFRHPLTREVAYGSQLGQRRRTLHGAAARALAEAEPERLDELAPLVAQHWEAAGEDESAAIWHARAATWAGLRDPAAALSHWRRVYELAAGDSDTAAGLGFAARLYLLAFGWRMGIAHEEAARIFEEAERMSADDPARQAQLLVTYATARLVAEGDATVCAPLARRAIAVAEESGDDDIRLNASNCGYALYLAGEYEEAITLYDRAIERASGDPRQGSDLGGNESPLAFAHIFRGGALSEIGRMDEALESLERGMAVAEAAGSMEILGWGHMNYVAQRLRRGETDAARTHAQQALELAERIGGAFSRSWAWHWSAQAAIAQGDCETARDAALRSQEIADQHRTAADCDGWRRMALARAYLGLGDAPRAQTLAREAADLMRERGSPHNEAGALLVLAEAILAAGDLGGPTEAAAALTRAQELIDTKRIRVLVPSLHETAAAVAGLEGDDTARARELREAHRLYTEMGARGHAERLAGVLASAPS